MARKQPCPVCGSTRWRKDPSGMRTCSEGHIQQGYREEEVEPDAAVRPMFGVSTRATAPARKKGVRKARRGQADEKRLHGSKALYFSYQCQQLILRLQIRALVKLWSLPAKEFEIVCRDLWALHLTLLPEPPPAEPLNPIDDDVADEEDKKDDEAVQVKQENPQGTQTVEEEKSDVDSSSDEEEEPEDEVDLELARMIEEAYPSQPPSQAEQEGDDELHSTKKRRINKGLVEPSTNISILFSACWTLRLPVIAVDFIRLIESYDLPYLEPLRHLHPSFLEVLSPDSYFRLSPSHPPTATRIHATASRLSRLIYTKFDIFTPPLNAAPILWRAVRAFRGSAILYAMSKSLSTVLELPLTLNRALAPTINPVVKDGESYRRRDEAPPEASIVATVVLAIKLVYGLDGQGRLPRREDDPAAYLPEAQAFLTTLKDHLAELRNSRQGLLAANSTRTAVNISEPDIDFYLDFCEKALLRPDGAVLGSTGRETDFTSVAKMFPLSDAAKDIPLEEPFPTSGRHLLAMGIYVAPDPLASDNGDNDSDSEETPSPSWPLPLQPGESHTIYSSEDILGALPPDYELVLELGAQWCGFPKEDIAALVEKYEKYLVRWEATRKKREKKAAGGEDVALEHG